MEGYNFLNDMNDGEKELYYLCKNHESDIFKVLPNALFKRAEKGTNQIDLIVVNKRGIFVIEMKDFRGWIFGDENHKEWTQTLKHGRRDTAKKYKFRNPIKQNDNHIKTVKQILLRYGYNLPVYNVVVFGKDAFLQDVNSSVDVINIDAIMNVLTKYPELSISDSDIKDIYQFLEFENIKSYEERKKHLEYIDEIHESDDAKINKDFNNKSSNPFKQERYQGRRRINTREKILVAVSCALILYMSMGFLNRLLTDNKPKNDVGANNNNMKIGSGTNTPTNNGKAVIGANTSSNRSGEDKKAAAPANAARENLQGGRKFINIDSSTEEVKSIVGEADKINYNKWLYGNSYITFNVYNKVDGWSNAGELTKVLNPIKKGVGVITLDDTMEKVTDVLGAADSVYMNKWQYGKSYISFNAYKKVDGWYNAGELTKGLGVKKEGVGVITLDCTMEQVTDVFGAPTKIYHNQWSYGNSYITFNAYKKVDGWNNFNELADGLGKKRDGSGVIMLESTMEQVTNILGAPVKIYHNDWTYGNSYITFDAYKKVTGWHNTGELTSGLAVKKEGAGVITLDVTMDQVINVLGTPTKIYYKQWSYGNSYITFNLYGKVDGWNNLGELTGGLGKRREGTGVISKGSTMEYVTNVMGAPNKIYNNNWQYGNSSITFNLNKTVENWNNTGNLLVSTK